MCYTVRLTPQAQCQLDEAMAWYMERDRQVAHDWYEGFWASIQGLSENPFIHGLSRESDLFGDEPRDLLYGSGRKKTHRAVFRVVRKTVEVVAIRHLAQRDLTPEESESLDSPTQFRK